MLEARLNRANWIVKGGVNLRAWFGSRRYSEDLDLDVIKCAQHVLRERFDQVLLSRPLAEMLTTQGLEITRISRPKQTDTTQRWKIELKAAGPSVPLHTKVEFSRRATRDEGYALEPVRPDIVRPYVPGIRRIQGPGRPVPLGRRPDRLWHARCLGSHV